VTAPTLVILVWSVIAAAAFLLGLMHLSRSVIERSLGSDLTFAVISMAFVGVATTELQTMLADSPEAWGAWVRWTHLPLAVLLIGTVVFVRQYLGAGRAWLAWSLIILRLAILGINFASDPNINFERIDSVRRMSFLGEDVTVVGDAVTGRWQPLGTLATLLLVVFVLDAAITSWRRGNGDARRRAAVIAGGLLTFIIVASSYVQLVLWGLVSLPLLITPSFTIAMLAMAYELSRDSLHASRNALELERSRVRLELAAEAADLGLCEWDSRAGTLWATQRAKEIFGLAEPDASNFEKWLERLHPDDAPRVRDVMQSALETGRGIDQEFRISVPRAGTRWISSHGRAEIAADGHTPVHVRGVIRDISAERGAMQETQELRRELAHVSRVSVLGQLASSLAHELSQPLGAILRNSEAAELLLGEPRPDVEELKAVIADIHRDDLRAGEVIHRLRALLKRRQMDVQPVSFETLVGDVASLVRGDALARHVALEMFVEPGLPPVTGDRVHLSQVLINLIINAMDAVMGRAITERQVAVGARYGQKGSVIVSVEDNGPGIPPGDLARIFEPFFTTKDSGMGMGLSVCRTIVSAHGGTLSVENVATGGARFEMRLPADAGWQA
jgi:signal transduction histidine kinase